MYRTPPGALGPDGRPVGQGQGQAARGSDERDANTIRALFAGTANSPGTTVQQTVTNTPARNVFVNVSTPQNIPHVALSPVVAQPTPLHGPAVHGQNVVPPGQQVPLQGGHVVAGVPAPVGMQPAPVTVPVCLGAVPRVQIVSTQAGAPVVPGPAACAGSVTATTASLTTANLALHNTRQGNVNATNVTTANIMGGPRMTVPNPYALGGQAPNVYAPAGAPVTGAIGGAPAVGALPPLPPLSQVLAQGPQPMAVPGGRPIPAQGGHVGGAAHAQGSVHVPPVHAPVQSQQVHIQDPFGIYYNESTPTLFSQQEILNNVGIVNFHSHRPTSELELLLTTQSLIQVGLNYPYIVPEVKARLLQELSRMTSNQWTSAVSGLANRIGSSAVTMQRPETSIVANLRPLIDAPVCGTNSLSSGAIRSLQVALQRNYLTGGGSDVINYLPLLVSLRTCIEQFSLDERSAYILSRELFKGSLGHFLSAAFTGGLSYGSFFRSVQNTLASTRRPSSILSLIARLKAVKPTNIVITLNELYQTMNLYGHICNISQEETTRSTRAAFFEVLHGHFPQYYFSCVREDSAMMSQLSQEVERRQRLGLEVNSAQELYHPILSLISVIQYVLAGDAVSRQTSSSAQGGGHGFVGGEARQPRHQRHHVNNADLDEVSMHVNVDGEVAAAKVDDAGEGDICEDEDGIVSMYNSLLSQLDNLESLASEKKYSSYPTMVQARYGRQGQGGNNTAGIGKGQCFRCGSDQHFIAACHHKPNYKKSSNNGQRSNTETAISEMATHMTIDQLNAISDD
jgi:hypothetical protein